jgi:glycosyltransferase involved in cell wall biosynthesis
MKKSSQPFFSVVIPALNEEKYLPLLLRDLTKQSFANFEVIVVNGNSEDKTVAKAETFSKKLKLSILNTEVRNVSFQRNIGAEKAKANWIIFMDADNRLPEYFLTGLQYQLLKDPTIDCFTTWTKLKSASGIERLIELSINYGLELTENMGKPFALGALIGCNKTVFKQIKFDTKMTINEDSKFVNDAHLAGFKFMLLREPQFFYSSRRIKKEGNLKIIRVFLNNQTRYILGGDFSKPYSNKGYPMLGGSYYEKTEKKNTLANWLEMLESSLKTASQKQLEQARRTLKYFTED